MSSTSDNEGPVTKLARLVAAQSIAAQKEARSARERELWTQAIRVGETASALAGLGRRHSERRSSQLQQQHHQQQQRLSVASRSRASADILTSYESPKATSDDAGISRGKFSPAQVKHMIDLWGEEDTEDEDEKINGSSNDSNIVYQCNEAQHYLPYSSCSSLEFSPNLDSGQSWKDQVNNEPDHSTSSSSGGGILESARNWLNTQRERLARIELEKQVEDQRRRLSEAQGWRRDSERETPLSRRGYDGTEYDAHDAAIHGIASLCGLTNIDADDEDECTSAPCIDASAQLAIISAADDYFKVSTPMKTVSGKGMSVKVDLHNHSRDTGEEVKVIPEVDGAPILSVSQMTLLILSDALPPSLNHCKWKRLYSLSRDGDSFDSFLRCVQDHERTVLVVRTTRGEMFGGYADTRWTNSGMRRANEFYGNGQAVLFRFRDDEVQIYRWTGVNRYVQLCDAARRILAFGGGGDEGVFGLCIEDDFRRGTTGHCSTFENEALCEDGYFDVMDLEVWGFTLDF